MIGGATNSEIVRISIGLNMVDIALNKLSESAIQVPDIFKMCIVYNEILYFRRTPSRWYSHKPEW